MATVILPNRDPEDFFDPSIFDASIDMDDPTDEKNDFNDSFIDDVLEKVNTINKESPAVQQDEPMEEEEEVVVSHRPKRAGLRKRVVIEKVLDDQDDNDEDGSQFVRRQVEQPQGIEVEQPQRIDVEQPQHIEVEQPQRIEVEKIEEIQRSQAIPTETQVILVQSQVVQTGEKGTKRKSDTTDVGVFAKMNASEQRNLVRLKLLESLNMEMELIRIDNKK